MIRLVVVYTDHRLNSALECPRLATCDAEFDRLILGRVYGIAEETPSLALFCKCFKEKAYSSANLFIFHVSRFVM